MEASLGELVLASGGGGAMAWEEEGRRGREDESLRPSSISFNLIQSDYNLLEPIRTLSF